MITASGFSKAAFYGKKNVQLNIKARLSRREKEYKKWPAPTSYQPRLGGPSSQWKIFRTQKEAFNFAKSTFSDLHVFSCESEGFFNKSGQRLFLVTSYDQFWHYYRQLGNAQRHHYEVIPEGSVCHLYFDLEFYKKQNPQRNGDEMVNIYLKYVNIQLDKIFHISCTRDQVLQLNSSTEEKFSQHLVYHLNEAVFQDNIEAGYFVHHICDELLDLLNRSDKSEAHHCCKRMKTDDQPSTATDSHLVDTMVEDQLLLSRVDLEDLEKLLVKDRDDRDVLFCDQGVYTRNRNFRLYLSCKLGKNNPLVVAKDNKYVARIPPDVKRSREEQIFLDSLITNIKYQSDLRVLAMPTQKKVKQLLVKPNKRNEEEFVDGCQTSPYPELDAYITNLLNQGGRQGYIRRWSYFSMGELMVYDIAGNRWCGNVGRQHKSNNIIYVADIRRGVYYQKCHDPECKAINYRSEEYPLPKEVLPAAYFGVEDESLDDFCDFDEVPDADLLLAAIQVERNTPANAICLDVTFSDSEDDEDLLDAVKSAENS